MVSLINFKIVDDELEFVEDINNLAIVRRDEQEALGAQHHHHHRRTTNQNHREQDENNASKQCNKSKSIFQRPIDGLGLSGQKLIAADCVTELIQASSPQPPPPPGPEPQPSQSVFASRENFVVTWRRLRYVIEPKWHQKLLNLTSFGNKQNDHKNAHQSSDGDDEFRVDVGGSCCGRQQETSSADVVNNNNNNKNQQAANQRQTGPSTREHQQAAKLSIGKIVLDELDGSFKSGELTAILGPSGAGKTTLLDCLTGHKRNGLSGSVRISAYNQNQNQTQQARRCPDAEVKCNEQSASAVIGIGAGSEDVGCHQDLSMAPLGSRDRNLRVSIIPQNDHLMGHLTVYETLNYASKMKNCFEKEFNHKSNIKRIAQQLGLVSCLGTRINKLSGGQYKRVSIAQELLSSPDVLILDEPTSGLDAMTCYQTVQVLRKLTQIDESQLGNNHASINVNSRRMAVILTIHQPNSDVFQQFNHVYVVAQGGKCIFEGPPSSIDSVINKIGIQLPSINYNPATLIVEVAAGKFGLEAIDKLNDIQRKQYQCQDFDQSKNKSKTSSDEQTSTGDSAVECPSSTSSLSFGNDDNDVEDSDDDDNDDDRDHDRHATKMLHEDDPNNNCIISGGQVNRAFDMKSHLDDEMDENNNNSDKTKNSNNDSVVVLFGQEFAGVEKGHNHQMKLKGTNSARIAGSRNRKRTARIKRTNSDGSQVVAHPILATTTNKQLDDNKYDQPIDDLIGRGRLHGSIMDNSYEENATSRGNNNNNSQQTHRRKLHNNIISSSEGTNSNSSSGSGRDGPGGNGGGGGGGGDGGYNNKPSQRQEKRLKLNSLKAGQNFPFWRHTYLHFHRSWVSIVRDPMLCGMQLTLHILVPLMVSLVYGSKVGKPNACPRAGPVDIMAYALEPHDSSLQLQEDLRTTLENIGYIFFKLYGIIFAAMTVTVLTFPLDMHVLVKEFRNGWYGLSSYFIGRTLADVPFQLTLPLLAMSLSYYATGQPYSYMQWRFLSITGILILSSLIAQSQGLLFGAILMDRMKAAVFVAPAATTPIILFAGFLVRTQSIPSYLRPLSNLSYLRYAIEACLISRYGFNQCECDPAVFNRTVPELPPMARSMLDYWLSSFKPAQDELLGSPTANSTALLSLNNSTLPGSPIVELTTLPSPAPETTDLFGKLMDSLARANSFGRNITSCEQVVPYPMIDYNLKDSQLFYCFAILTTMLVVTRLLTFFIVSFKVKRKV